MRYSKGIMWLDDCRIPFVDEGENTSRKQTPISVEVYGWSKHKGLIGSFDDSAKQGRFTPNLLVCDNMLNDGSVSKGQKNPRIQKTTRRYGENNFPNGGLLSPEGNITATYNDMGSPSRFYDLDLWFDKMIDEIRI